MDLYQTLTKINANATVWAENGTFYVGIQYPEGRLVLGYASTVKKAVDLAVAKHEG